MRRNGSTDRRQASILRRRPPLDASSRPPGGPRRRGLLALAGAVTIAGCGALRRPTRVPMEVLKLAGPCPGPAPVLLVMLPGAYSRPRDFVSEGFVDALRSRAIAADIALPDASLGYFEDRSVLRRLREDVVLPARERGTRQIWLVGISLGGFAALGYAARHGEEIAGVVALAPYLGRRTLIQAIAAAGGPRAWARAPVVADDDLEAELWRALAGGRIVPPVYLGYGRDDRFADAHALLRTLLPAEHCFDTAGGHDWPPWRALWNAWLARGLLPTACDAA